MSPPFSVRATPLLARAVRGALLLIRVKHPGALIEQLSSATATHVAAQGERPFLDTAAGN